MRDISVDDRFLPSESWDIAMGRLYDKIIAEKGNEYEGSGYYAALVKSVGEELADCSERPHLPFTFTVINGSTDTVGNAECLPGGKVTIQVTLIEEVFQTIDSFDVGCFSLREKMAGLIAHEISHATLRHKVREGRFLIMVTLAWIIAEYALSLFLFHSIPTFSLSWSSMRGRFFIVSSLANMITSSLAQNWLSRSNELEADRESIYTLVRAGYDPKVAVWMGRFFESQDVVKDSNLFDHLVRLFSTHPDPAHRAELNAQTIAEMNIPYFLQYV